jgi:hypothetical protein
MALIDIQEQVRAALYDVVRLQFVCFLRAAVDFAAAAGTGRGTQVTVAGFTGADLGDVILTGPETALDADAAIGVPQVTVAGSIVYTFSSGNGAVNPVANVYRTTVLRAM